MPNLISIASAIPNVARKKFRYLKNPSRLKLTKQPKNKKNLLLYPADNNIPISQLRRIEKNRTRTYLGSPQA